MNNIEFVGEHAITYEVRWHTHEEWELVYCTAGGGSFQFDNGTVMHYNTGDTVVIPPQVLHSNISQNGFTNIHIRLSDPSFPYKSAFRVSDDSQKHLRVVFQQAKFYYLSDIKRSELVLSALGELVASYMVVFRSNSEFSKPVDQIRNMILLNYADADFALDEAMQTMPFHYDYLRKLFKKEMGLTPLEYMTRLRMKKAESMLTASGPGDYSVAEVAGLCGYSDALYFSRVFKKTFGVSPSAFINRRGTDKD